MSEQYTNAAEMARACGKSGKSFRARLRRVWPAKRIPGSWRTAVGSEEHRLMERELEAMVAKRA
jgi:hypothetical protein